MTDHSLHAADKIHLCQENHIVLRRSIDHPDFRRFSSSLLKFIRALGESASEDYWRPFLSAVRSYGYAALSTPLPFNHEALAEPNTVARLQTYLSNCEMIYPGMANWARDLLSHMGELRVLSDNPLLEEIATLGLRACTSESAVVLPSPKFLTEVEDAIAGCPAITGLQVATPHQLTEDKCYGELAVVSPAGWFPEYVFSAPRAPMMYIVQYNWLRDKYEPRSAFVAPVKQTRTRTQYEGTHLRRREELLDEDILAPKIDWGRLADRAVSGHNGEGEIEYILARLFLLEGGYAVLLEAAQDASALVIDLEAEPSSRVKRIPTSEIEEGMFLLLRTEGGGDYIVAVADQILGRIAGQLREAQKRWKSALRKVVRSTGLLETALQLLELGSRRANEANLRNWISERSIRTQHYEDFLAIMRLTGLESYAEEYWNMMDKIDSAHRSAGFRIRRQLMKEVRGSDIQALQKLGTMDFELSAGAGGKLTAFRVTGISPDTTLAPYTHISHPLLIEQEV